MDPFTKRADGESGLPGLNTAADVLGWRAGPLNANWGGPRPLTNLLIGAGLGSLGGYGIGRLAEEFLPEKYFKEKGLRNRGALLGGLLGGAFPMYQAFDNVRETGRLGSITEAWPPKQACELTKEAFEPFNPTIHRSQFSQYVFGDDNTPPALQAATAGLVEAASAVSGREFVSPFDVARVAAGAGTGLVSGLIAGKALGVLAGLSPEARNGIQRIGMWSGILNSVIPPALGLR